MLQPVCIKFIHKRLMPELSNHHLDNNLSYVILHFGYANVLATTVFKVGF